MIKEIIIALIIAITVLFLAPGIGIAIASLLLFGVFFAVGYYGTHALFKHIKTDSNTPSELK
jgi:uncharacterized membrane protein